MERINVLEILEKEMQEEKYVDITYTTNDQLQVVSVEIKCYIDEEFTLRDLAKSIMLQEDILDYDISDISLEFVDAIKG